MNRADVVTIRELRRKWRAAADAYHADPLAGTRDLNQNDQARERMRATRAAQATNKENS